MIYELHVGTFTPDGTFDSAIEKLDYLVDLGVDFVELMPVNAFGGTHGWGYDGVLWYAVHEPYGGPDGLVRFVDACHRRGLGVLIDAVFNHLGPSGNYLPRFGPYLSSGSNPWGESINIADADADEVRRYILDCALRWMRDFHADGLRLDAVHALVDTTAIHILEELSAETDALAAELGRPLSLIAESDLQRSAADHPARPRRLGMTAQWDDDIHHAIHAAVSGERQGYYADFGSLETLATDVEERLLPRGHVLVVPASPARPPAGHRDASRRPGCWPTRSPTTRSATAPSATGRRRTWTSASSPSRRHWRSDHPIRQCFSWARSGGRQSPFQFFSSHPEPELARATAEGRKAEFAEHGWDADEIPDPQDPETFRRSKLNWDEIDDGEHGRLRQHLPQLIALRHNEPDMADPWLDHLRVDYDEDAAVDRDAPRRIGHRVQPRHRCRRRPGHRRGRAGVGRTDVEAKRTGWTGIRSRFCAVKSPSTGASPVDN